MNLVDPFNRSKPPTEALDRPARVVLLVEVASALLEGEPPSRQAALFVGGALQAWLSEGGHLTRDFFKVTSVRGSHETPRQIAARLSDPDPSSR